MALQLAERDDSVDASLIVAYASWEALQCRVVAAALRRQGYAMRVAHEFLGQTTLNDRQPVSKIAPLVLGRRPQQIPDAGTHWQAIEAWSTHRNGLVHGLSTYSPTELRAGVVEIVTRVANPEWLEPVKVPRELGGPVRDGVPLGDVLGAQRGGPRNGFGAEQLAKTMRVLRTGHS